METINNVGEQDQALREHLLSLGVFTLEGLDGLAADHQWKLVEFTAPAAQIAFDTAWHLGLLGD
jgi:hypothetical protein